MTEWVPRPSGFRLSRYPKNLWGSFPAHWVRGERVEPVAPPVAPPPAEETEEEVEMVFHRPAACAVLGLTPAQLLRAMQMGMPFELPRKRVYAFNVPVCMRWIHEHAAEVFAAPHFGRRPLMKGGAL